MYSSKVNFVCQTNLVVKNILAKLLHTTSMKNFNEKNNVNKFLGAVKFLTIQLALILLSLIAIAPNGGALVFCAEKENPLLEETKLTNASKYKMAIVIDDFGCDRHGVQEMLDLNCRLTCAIMPCLEYSEEDAKNAHAKGHEVILHMPMESYGRLPEHWYGPLYIKNTDSPEIAKQKLEQGLNSVPYADAVNIHMGTAVCQNKNLMQGILEYTKGKNLVFLDSRTIEGSVCKSVGDQVGAKVLERDLFLEVGGPSYRQATESLTKAVNICKEKGSAIVIGHVGPVGTNQTARAIKDFLPILSQEGIEVVPLSKLSALAV